jgi:hypothetical protein
MTTRYAQMTDAIYKQYREVQLALPGNAKASANDRLFVMAVKFQDALFDLVFSGNLTEGEQRELIFAGQGVSCAKEDNEHWKPFLDRVRGRALELSAQIQDLLEWYSDVQGW